MIYTTFNLLILVFLLGIFIGTKLEVLSLNDGPPCQPSTSTEWR
jgi:hypothetical protein